MINSDPGLYAYMALLVGSVGLAVVLAVRWWSVPRWRVLGLTACVWLPLLMFVGFQGPGDSCTDEQRRDLPAYSCDHTTDS